MLQLHPITTLDAPELEPYRTMRRSYEHQRLGIFVAEGEKVARRLAELGIEIVSLLLTEEWVPQFEKLLAGRGTIPAYIAPRKLMETITGFGLYQGVLAVGRIPPALSLDELLARAPAPRLFVALDGLTNSENLGVIMRTAVALGGQGVLTSETCSSPWLRRSVRNSMGAVFRVPVLELSSLVDTLTTLRARGVRCIAAHPHTDQRRLSQADFRGDCCLVFGSEGNGISAPVLAVCDERVAIPMAANVDSLNVASASAAFFYEAARQRGAA